VIPRKWRVGSHYGIHVYEITNSEPGTENDDRPVATFHTAQDARNAVAAFNKSTESASAATQSPVGVAAPVVMPRRMPLSTVSVGDQLAPLSDEPQVVQRQRRSALRGGQVSTGQQPALGTRPCECGKDAPYDGGAEGVCPCCSTCTTGTTT
jgi:hypothetical protein